MTINIISDLHCRNKSFPPSFDPKKLEPADVLVVAGDLGTRPSYAKIEQKINDETKGIRHKGSQRIFIRLNN